MNILSFISVGCCISSGILFSITSCKNPGYVTKTFGDNFLGLLEIYRSDFLCFYCENRKNRNTHHCHNCKKCVNEFDHHCHWVHNCIGKDNYTWFIFWLIFSLFDFCSQISIGIFDYLEIYTTENKQLFLNEKMHFKFLGILIAGFNLFGAIIIGRLLLLQVWESCKRKKTKKIFNFSDVKNNLKNIEFSDTDSMLMRSSEDWGVRSYYIK